jgi:hypothetical protein
MLGTPTYIVILFVFLTSFGPKQQRGSEARDCTCRGDVFVTTHRDPPIQRPPLFYVAHKYSELVSCDTGSFVSMPYYFLVYLRRSVDWLSYVTSNDRKT